MHPRVACAVVKRTEECTRVPFYVTINPFGVYCYQNKARLMIHYGVIEY